MQAANEVGVTLKQGYNGDLTSKQAGSIGGWYTDVDTFGGFFGTTKFIYDIDGVEYTLVGTDHPDHNVTFVFE